MWIKHRNDEMPTYEELAAVFAYDPATGQLTFKDRPPEWFKTKASWAGWRAQYLGKSPAKKRRGYLVLCMSVGGKTIEMMAHRAAWLLHYGSWPEHEIDHIDGNRSNNAISNLRPATHTQNQWNKRICARNKSGYRGVHFMKANGKFRAQIVTNGVRRHVGLFDTAEQAHAAYIAAAASQRGEYATA